MSEQGAIAAIVAMLFGFGVLLSLAALTVDVGNINADRRQLQNGADAVALAVAQQCAKDGTCKIAGADLAVLQKLVDTNAADGATSIQRVAGGAAICGTLPGLPPCTGTPSMSNLQECPPAPESSVNYVQVYTETANSDTPRKNILPYYFGAAITGITGANQQACARVGVAPGYDPKKVLAVTDALCAWQDATKNGSDFPPPYNPPPLSVNVPVDAKYVTKILLQGSGGSGDPISCGKSTSGAFIPGNFGWLSVKAGTKCQADIAGGTGVVVGSTGASPPKNQPDNNVDCAAYIEAQKGTIVYIPIFTATSAKGGGNATFTLDGVAPFFLAGAQAQGMTTFSLFNPVDPNNVATPHCIDNPDPKKDGSCLWGWFVDKTIPWGEFSKGPPRGATVFGLLG